MPTHCCRNANIWQGAELKAECKPMAGGPQCHLPEGNESRSPKREAAWSPGLVELSAAASLP